MRKEGGYGGKPPVIRESLDQSIDDCRRRRCFSDSVHSEVAVPVVLRVRSGTTGVSIVFQAVRSGQA